MKEKILAFGLLLFAIGYNLWIYRLEPTAKIDPNDNPFQFALVNRTNEMWDFAGQTCPHNPLFPLCFSGYLIDHWVPNWAQGFNLPYYYSHWPQIAIVASYRFLIQPLSHSTISLFSWYHIIIYLLMCLFPISVFWALKVLKLPWYVIGFGALASTQISTDGLYGLDPSSFLWRGYGLSSQLFSMIFLPPAIAYSYRFLSQKISLTNWSSVIHQSSFLLAVLFLVLSIMGHLGIGVIALMSVGFLAIGFPLTQLLYKQPIKEIIQLGWEKMIAMIMLTIPAVTILSYWIVPAFLNDQYHNTSFWDPVWKFNSWGWKEVMQQFFNGNLFDFGRFPIFTFLCIIGGFAVFFIHRKLNLSNFQKNNLQPFAFLFLLWLVFFFGRTTWGGLIDLIPSMKDFHQSRFIVGLHLAGFFIAPIGFWYISEWLIQVLNTLFGFSQHLIRTMETEKETAQSVLLNHTQPSTLILTWVPLLFSIILFLYLSPQTNAYASYNDLLIKRGNDYFQKGNSDVQLLIDILKKLPPGRVYVGRGGSWGKNLQVAETTSYYMHLSTYGIPVILWLPETWSPSSDVEQFFIEENPVHYNLMNIRYVVTPPDLNPQSFWKKIAESPSWKLYTVDTEGYFTSGTHAAVIETKKEYYINLVRLWLQSDYPQKKLFPELTFNHQNVMNTSLPAFTMIDEATYRLRDGTIHGLFGEVPTYEAPQAKVTLGTDQTIHDMIFKTTATIGSDCHHCLVIFKQSFHPSWKAWVNGQPAKTFTVFPFYTAVEVNTPGTTTIEFRYQPSLFKLLLFIGGTVEAILLFFPRQRFNRKGHSFPS